MLKKMEKKAKFPYFRFTEKCTDINDAITWYNHFVAKDIPCCIVKSYDENEKILKPEKRAMRHNLIESYSVWVWGIENTSINQAGTVDGNPNSENIETFGEVIVSTKQFKKNYDEYIVAKVQLNVDEVKPIKAKPNSERDKGK